MFTLKKRGLIMIISCLLTNSCLWAQESIQETVQSEKLLKVWETPEELNIPESSCYNPGDKTIYVSNIVGNPDKKDGEGFISKISDKGKIIEKEWVKGLNAPKGIGITNGKLYVTDIDEVVEISLKTAQITRRYKTARAHSFNDIATDKQGHVYVSEMQQHLVLRVGKDSLEVFAESDQIAGVNGICDYGKEVILGSKGNLIAIDKETKAIRILVEKTGYLDGIVVVGNNKIVTSDWKGKVQLISPGKPTEVLLNTASQKINAADLGWISSKQLLLVPTFSNNKIIAFKLKL